MARGKTTSAVIHQAFKEAFRKAHSEQFGVLPNADTTHQAWEETVAPVLEKAWPGYEDLTVSAMLYFVKHAVHEAMKKATGAQS